MSKQELIESTDIQWTNARQSSLFYKINPGELEPMLACLGSYIRKYEKEEYIYIQNDDKRLGVVLYGGIHMLKESVDGDRMLLDIVKEGEVFGEGNVAFGYDSRLIYHAPKGAGVLWIPYQKVFHVCNMNCSFHHQFIENIIRTLVEKNALLLEKIEIISKKTLRDKIMSYLLLQEKKDQERYITIPMGRVAWAEYLNANRSALSRELKAMKEEGLIDYDRNICRIIRRKEDV